MRESIVGASREYFTVTVAFPIALFVPSSTSTLRVFDHSKRPETVAEKPPDVSEVVVAFLLVPIKTFTVLVGFVLPDTTTVALLTVVSATGSSIVTVAVSVVVVPPAVILIDFVTSAYVSLLLSITVIS